MVALMEGFLAAPLETPDDIMHRILIFTSKSPDVAVVIHPALSGFLDDEIDERTQQLLLMARIAGSAVPQLRSGKKGDDARAGVLATLQVYSVLKARGAFSPSMERLLELQQNGELDAHIVRVNAAPLPSEPSAAGAPAPTSP
jgi:hypothetical protein